MRRALPLLACLALGCDMTIADAVEHVEDHGVLMARAECESTSVTNSGGFARWSCAQLADGSTIATMCVKANGGMCATRFCGASESCSETCSASVRYQDSDETTGSYSSGTASIDPASGSAVTMTIDTECTGFNLEAFD